MSQKKEFIAFKFTVKEAEADGDTGFLSGFVSVFNNVDHGRDIVHPGAFTKTIKENKGVIPFLLDHNPYKPAGYSTVMEEQAKGLYYESELKLHDLEVKQRYELAKLSLKLGKPMGNSFGYYGVKYDYEERETEDGAMMVRNLREIKLYEGSLVTFPMNDAAGVTDAKSLDTLLALIQKGGYSSQQIQDALQKFADSGAARDKDDPAIRQSIEALKAIRFQ